MFEIPFLWCFNLAKLPFLMWFEAIRLLFLDEDIVNGYLVTVQHTEEEAHERLWNHCIASPSTLRL